MRDIPDFLPRSLSAAIEQALTDTPVVVVLGPRQCGKTTLVRHLAPDRAYFTLDSDRVLQAALDDPDGFVDALPAEVTIAEVQRAPTLLNSIKRAVDDVRRPGQFILTGSANLLMLPRVTESLAGRMEILQLHPLNESEKTGLTGRFLQELIQAPVTPLLALPNQVPEDDWVTRLFQGGYPVPVRREPGRVRAWYRQYLRGLLEQDVDDVARIRNTHELGRTLAMISQQTAELLNVSRIGNALGLDRRTVENHLLALERLFLVRRLPAWHRNAAKRLVKAPKLHLLDSGLAATLSDLQPADFIDTRHTLGHLLESFVLQQLIAQSAWTKPELQFWHYRDKDGVEVDIVMTQGRKTWGIEVKASRAVRERDGRGLARLADQCGSGFQQGFVIHTGRDLLPMKNRRLLAVPLSVFWDR